MTKEEKCDGNCCEHFFDDYNEDEDDYEVQRLKDIIRICEFLIQSKQHKKDKKKMMDKLQQEVEDIKDTEDDKPYRVYTYKWPRKYRPYRIPYWDQIWF